MEDPPPRILKQVASELARRTRDLPREDGGEKSLIDPRLRVVADILNATSAGADKEILERLEEDASEMVVELRECMFSWSDLVMIDVKTMQRILAGVDTKLLALALKACDEEVTEAILSATSQRTRDMIMEERELIGSVPLAEALDAQNQILQGVRELMESGEISVSRGSSAAMVT